ncbi:MAG: phosphoribosyltransferase family protein [Anaerolineae bacterium]
MFKDRKDAGVHLVALLEHAPIIAQTPTDDLLVLSIPRGGVVVGAVVAQTMGCKHDVVIVKKIGFPTNEEMAVGAMAEDGWTAIDRQTLHYYGLAQEALKPSLAQTRAKIEYYKTLFRHGKALNVTGKIVIVVDDGVATGETMKAAVHWVQNQGCEKVVVAVPVAAPSTARELGMLADAFVCLFVPDDFVAVGQFYEHFEQVEDEEVLKLLGRVG